MTHLKNWSICKGECNHVNASNCEVHLQQLCSVEVVSLDLPTLLHPSHVQRHSCPLVHNFFVTERTQPMSKDVRVTYYARHAFVALKVVNFALNCFSESSVTPQLSESTWFKLSIICQNGEMDRAAAGLSWQSKGWLVIKWQRSK